MLVVRSIYQEARFLTSYIQKKIMHVFQFWQKYGYMCTIIEMAVPAYLIYDSVIEQEAVFMAVQSAIMVPHPPLIIPEVGKGQERAIQDTINSCGRAASMLVELGPETIIVISPHSLMYSDYFHISPGISARGSFDSFGAGSVRFEVDYDAKFAAELSRQAELSGLSAGTLGERDKKLDHGTMVPLYFIQQAYGGSIKCRILRIGLSGQPLSEHYRLGMLIQKTAELLDRKVGIVASGDLSHVLKEDGPYGYREEGPVYDRRIMDVMSRAAFGELFDFSESFCKKAGECGHRSFMIMAGCFDGVSVRAEKLSYEGPFGVGYGVCVFLPEKPDANRKFLDPYLKKQKQDIKAGKGSEDPYVHLARKAVESYILHGKIIDVPDDLPDELLAKRAGTFVSLKKNGQLRGCIGTIAPTTNCIAEAIIRNAISASTQDPRFDPVSPAELDELVYSVDVLGQPEDIDSPKQLDVKRYGVIVSSGHKRGLLLPDLDGVDTVEEQISIAKQKAGIRDGEDVRLQRFEVVRHY